MSAFETRPDERNPDDPDTEESAFDPMRTDMDEGAVEGYVPDWVGSETPHIVVLTGPLSGKIISLREGEQTTIGRDADCGIRVQDSKVSRLHARITLPPGGRPVITDLGSSNGTFVNETRVDEKELDEGDKIRIGRTIILKFSYQDDLERQAQEELFSKGTKDPLTGAFNREFLDIRLEEELGYSRRHKTPLSVLVIDIDRFKLINDTHGHPAGDQALMGVVAAIRSQLRGEDILARLGGDEFLAVLRGTPGEGARRVAERMGASIAGLGMTFGGEPMAVTVSIGIGTVPVDGSEVTREDLIGEADRNLYLAKEAGRNQTRGPG